MHCSGLDLFENDSATCAQIELLPSHSSRRLKTIPPAALYDQLTNFFLIVHDSPLNLAKDPSATLHPQSGMICLLIQGSPPPLIPLSTVSRQSSLPTSAAHLATAGASDSALLLTLCTLQITILLLLLL